MYCTHCGKQVGEEDAFCKYCGASQQLGITQWVRAAQVNATATPTAGASAAPSTPVRIKSTHQMKLGAVLFVACLFGACPAGFLSGDDSTRALLVVGAILGMIVGAIMYFAGS